MTQALRLAGSGTLFPANGAKVTEGRYEKRERGWPSPFMVPELHDEVRRGAIQAGWPVIDHPLFGGLRHHVDRHVFTAKLAFVKAHAAFRESEQGVILTHAHVHTRIHLGTTLADDDVAADHFLTTELLDAKAAAS